MLSARPGPFRLLPERAPRDAKWMWALLGVTVVLYAMGLDVRLRCRLHAGCHWSRDRWFDLDSIGGLPRLFITGLFLALAVLAWRARRRTAGRARTWWTAIAAIGVVLAVLKVVSAHSAAKADSVVATLTIGVVLTGVVLAVLWRTAQRWDVAAGPSVVVAFAVYAFAALGLDALTGVVAGLSGATGVVADSVATFVEEFGEALGALLVLTIVWWWLPALEGSAVSRV